MDPQPPAGKNTTGAADAIEPLLDPGFRAEWVTVDRELVEWAWRQRGDAISRWIIHRAYDGYHSAQKVTFVPCENGCGRDMQEGEPALLIIPPSPTQRTRRKVFCSVACERRRYVEQKANARKKIPPRT